MTIKPIRIQFKTACELLNMSRESLRHIVRTDASFPRPIKTGENNQSPTYFDYVELMQWHETQKSSLKDGDLIMQELIYVQNGQAVTTDILIAKAFNKRPSSVIRAIKILNCSEEFRRLNFEHTYYVDQQGKKQQSYLITKDGFVLLVMGFTGKHATDLKIRYIEAFNEKEKYLQSEFQRFNDLCQHFHLRKDDVSKAAKNMVCWKHDKPRLLNLIESSKKRLQLDLF